MILTCRSYDIRSVSTYYDQGQSVPDFIIEKRAIEIVRTKLAEDVSHSKIVKYVTDMTGMSRSWGYREIRRQTQPNDRM